jgi:hypothetical protein
MPSLSLSFSLFVPDSFIGNMPWGRKDLVDSSLVGVVAGIHFGGLKLDGLLPGDIILVAPPLDASSCALPLPRVDCVGMLPLIALPSGME